MEHRLHNERGMMMISYIIGGMVLLAGAFWYAQWNWTSTRQSMGGVASNQAMQFAESAVNDGRQRLKAPDINYVLSPGQTITISSPVMEKGRYEMTLRRLVTDSSLVDGVATGYFFIPSGGLTDPVTQRPSKRAVLSVRYQISNASTYVFALPNDLTVESGRDLGNDGRIYARRLSFAPGATINLGAAFYYSECLSGTTPTEAPSNVVFNLPPNRAQKLTSPLNLPALDYTIRNGYIANAAPGTTSSFAGVVSDVADKPVYYVDGDVDIAPNRVDFNPSGVYVIYATGNIYIHGNIRPLDSASWVGLLSEKDIRISPDAPPTLELNATIFANRSFVSDARYPATSSTPGQLTINGGIVVLQNIGISKDEWATSVYRYKTSSDPRLRLPNFSEVISYRVVTGG